MDLPNASSAVTPQNFKPTAPPPDPTNPISMLNPVPPTPLPTTWGQTTTPALPQGPKQPFENTPLGIGLNTVSAFLNPMTAAKVGAGMITNLKDQFTNPSPEQKNYEATTLPYGTTPVTKVLTAPGVAAARAVTRFINPVLQPFANDIAELRAVNEKGGILDMIHQGKIPASSLNEFAILQKTAPQVVGDVAQAVLAAYSGSEAPALASEAKNLGIEAALKKGATTGLKVGTLFGGAQALSSGSTNPLEIASTVGQTGIFGSVFGAITSGAIPVSKEVLGKV